MSVGGWLRAIFVLFTFGSAGALSIDCALQIADCENATGSAAGLVVR